MKTNLHIGFDGNCRDAFAFYSELFSSPIVMSMTYGEMPGHQPADPRMQDKIMHTGMRLGTMTLMGADNPPERGGSGGGYMISLEEMPEAELRRVFGALSEGGKVQMPLQSTFWTPLFGMVEDRFGTQWMMSLPGVQD